MEYFEVEFSGEVKRVWAQTLGTQLWFHVDGKTYSIDTKPKRMAKSETKAAQGEILAPMPGKVLKVCVKAGDKVSGGQLLVVMEAMKMEYSFSSEFDGVIEHVSCAEGDQVSLSQVLVKVVPQDG